MRSEAITQPVSQGFPDNSGVKRSLAGVLRRKEGFLTWEAWRKGILGSLVIKVVLSGGGVVIESYFFILIGVLNASYSTRRLLKVKKIRYRISGTGCSLGSKSKEKDL